ncbi:hypothetical protein EYF80_051169 [Liparis tanakae]|uniref:Uncharacterized protein n=1 Tax=Liparis tanakae TaxID=230148 RepID=A0A4Z2FE19_9TELE|nr:hypothetical protein EYF80_051169 [Liparis tanakae]
MAGKAQSNKLPNADKFPVALLLLCTGWVDYGNETEPKCIMGQEMSVGGPGSYDLFKDAFNLLKDSYDLFKDAFNLLKDSYDLFKDAFNLLKGSYGLFKDAFNLLKGSYGFFKDAFNLLKGSGLFDDPINADNLLKEPCDLFKVPTSPSETPYLVSCATQGGPLVDKERALRAADSRTRTRLTSAAGEPDPSHPLDRLPSAGVTSLVSVRCSSRVRTRSVQVSAVTCYRLIIDPSRASSGLQSSFEVLALPHPPLPPLHLSR